MVDQVDRPLLRAAVSATERGDFSRADALFQKHIAQEPCDAVALTEYGSCCLCSGRQEVAGYLLHKASKIIPSDVDLLSQLGYARMEMHDIEGARESFASALELQPTHAQANYGYAICLRLSGDTKSAVVAFKRSLATLPDSLPILLNLADAYHSLGDSVSAGAHFERAWRIAPDDPDVLLERGKFLRDIGAYAQAIGLLECCILSHRDAPIAKIETAKCLRMMGEYERAIRLLNDLETTTPGMPESHEEFGNCYASVAEYSLRDRHWQAAIELWIRNEQFVQAKPLLERMLESSPALATGWVLQGIFHRRQQKFDMAETAYLKAIKIDPECVEAHANLASLYEQINQLDKARFVIEAGLELKAVRDVQMRAPNFALHLTSCRVARRQQDYPRGFDALDQIEQIQLTDADRQQAGFERGKLLDLVGNESDAISAFGNANAIARARWIKDHPGKNTYLCGVERMLELIQAGWLQKWGEIDVAPPRPDPIFLVGFPRSGTTLLNQILYCHSSTQTIEEKPMVQAMHDMVGRMPVGYPDAILKLDTHDTAYLRNIYFKVARQHGATDSSKLLIDKFPLHVTMAGLIHRVFPQSRFVFAVRHPCDVVLSCFMQDFHINEAMANFCSLDDAVALYTRTMDLWLAYRDQLSLVVHTVRYEDIVDDFNGETRALCEYLELPWEAGLQHFASKALERGKINTPSYEQVSKPIYRDARYRWERYRRQLEPYLSALRPYTIDAGYPDPMVAANQKSPSSCTH